MSKNILPVVAAIPNYNMADSLAVLLPQVLEQEYAGIYVLDDASTDHSQEVVEQFGNDVDFVAGTENVGAGGNRNRIIPAIGRQALIHFLDADVRLQSTDNPSKAQDIMSREDLGFVGGLVIESDGRQSPWNYGPRQSLYADLGATIQATRPDKHPKHLKWLMEDWPDLSKPPESRTTFWCVEPNLLIDSAVFTKLGGFDKKLREHDIQDLAIRTQRAGLVNIFDPSIAVSHTAVDVRNYNRNQSRLKAELYIARKNGLLQWLFPDGRLKPRYNQ